MSKSLLTALIALATLACSAQYTINQDLLLNTILLTYPNGVTGSGIILSDSPNIYLATARHMVYGTDLTKDVLMGRTVQVTAYAGSLHALRTNVFTIDLQQSRDSGYILVDAKNDAAVIFIAKKFGDLLGYPETILKENRGRINLVSIELIKPYDAVEVGAHVFVMGYPTSIGLNAGLVESDKPLICKGAVAGFNEHTRRIVINAPVYHGNSGGPVFATYPMENRTCLIGVVTDFVPYLSDVLKKEANQVKTDSVRAVVNNTAFGIVTPADNILTLIRQLKQHLP